MQSKGSGDGFCETNGHACAEPRCKAERLLGEINPQKLCAVHLVARKDDEIKALKGGATSRSVATAANGAASGNDHQQPVAAATVVGDPANAEAVVFYLPRQSTLFKRLMGWGSGSSGGGASSSPSPAPPKRTLTSGLRELLPDSRKGKGVNQ